MVVEKQLKRVSNFCPRSNERLRVIRQSFTSFGGQNSLLRRDELLKNQPRSLLRFSPNPEESVACYSLAEFALSRNLVSVKAEISMLYLTKSSATRGVHLCGQVVSRRFKWQVSMGGIIYLFFDVFLLF